MPRILIVLAGVVACIVTLALVAAQRRELAALREEEQQLKRQTEELTEAAPSNTPNESTVSSTQPSPSIELLRLRGTVGQLERRKRELDGVRAENDKLRAQLSTKSTNAPGGLVLPAGYIRKADAKLAGFNTPEDTIQSLLWAIQNRDVAGFLQTFDPQMAKGLEARLQSFSSPEEFFKDADVLPGLRILNKKNIDNGEVELTIEVIPGEKHPRPLYFKQFAGQWKLISGL